MNEYLYINENVSELLPVSLHSPCLLFASFIGKLHSGYRIPNSLVTWLKCVYL